MAALVVLWACPALANEPPFAVDTTAGRFEVVDWRPPGLAKLGRGDRVCALDLSWEGGGLVVQDAGCPAAVRVDAVRTVEGWSVRPPDAAADGVPLGTLWLVYPTDYEGPPRALVATAHDRGWSLPAAVDAVPVSIASWTFLRYPAAEHRPDRPDERCEVFVSAEADGKPDHVGVTGCAAPFAEAARAAIQDWRFEPSIVDGLPLGTRFSMTATFVARAAEAPVPGEVPSEESRALWAERQFGVLTKAERLWFIRAALAPPPRDLGPGQVLVTLPSAPDLGDRLPPRFGRAPEAVAEVPLPEGPPLLELRASAQLVMRAWSLPLPEAPAEGPASCPLLVQVDGAGLVTSWTEAACPESLREPALTATRSWVLRHDGAADPRVRVRVQAVLGFEDDQATIRFEAEDLVTPPDELPPHVHVARRAVADVRVPPRFPRGLSLVDGTCELQVRVSKGGRASEVDVVSCPSGFEGAARRAVRRWRWVPAELDGQPVSDETRVQFRLETGP